jgi:hypothetical protein
LVLLLVPARPTLFFPLRRKLQLPSAERLCTVLGRDCPAAADRPALPACRPGRPSDRPKWPAPASSLLLWIFVYPDFRFRRPSIRRQGGAGFRIPNSRFPKIARD